MSLLKITQSRSVLASNIDDSKRYDKENPGGFR